MSSKALVQTTLRTLKITSRYKRLKEAVDTLPLFQLSVSNFEKEIVGIHKVRESRRLTPREDGRDARFVDTLISAIASDQGHRSRCAEIKMECTRARMTLGRAVDKLRDYYLVDFADELKIMRTKEERLMLIDRALRQFTDYMADMDRIVLLCDTVIADIDKAAWAIKAITDAIKIHAAPERNI